MHSSHYVHTCERPQISNLCVFMFVFADAGTSRLDSRYFRESPMMHCDGDGQEDEDFSLYPRQSIIFPGKLILIQIKHEGRAFATNARPKVFI